MPKRMYYSPGVRETFTRPVVTDISRQILEMTGLPKDLKIFYPGETGVVAQTGSTVTPDPQFNNFASKPSLLVNADEIFQRDRILSTAVYYPDSPLIFNDSDEKVSVRPVFSPTELSISIEYRASDRDAAIRWRNDIRTRVSLMRDVFVHDITYSYIIDPKIIDILQQIHSMQEAVAPYGRTFQEYLNKFFDSKVRIVSNLAGCEQAWAVAETQDRVLGYFDFEDAPEEGNKNDASAAWDISFTYKVNYDKPLACLAEYPIVIHNQLMDEKYRQSKLAEPHDEYQATYSKSSGLFRQFEVYQPLQDIQNFGIAIPEYDEYVPNPLSIVPYTKRIVTFLVSVDEDNPLVLLDLKDLGEYEIDPIFIDFLRGEAPYLNQRGNSIFNIGIYENENLMDPDRYEVTDDLVVKFKDNPDLRTVYHVRFSIFERPAFLTKPAKLRLKKNCQIAAILLTALRYNPKRTGVALSCNIDNTMPTETFNTAVEYIDRLFDVNYTGREIYNFNTVMSLGVIAKRKT